MAPRERVVSYPHRPMQSFVCNVGRRPTDDWYPLSMSMREQVDNRSRENLGNDVVQAGWCLLMATVQGPVYVRPL